MHSDRLMLVLTATMWTVACKAQQPTTPPPAAVPPASQVAPASFARYQIVFSPHVRADTFLLDTQKGRVWGLVKFTDMPGDPSAFDEIDVIDSTGEIGMKWPTFDLIHRPPQVPAAP